MIKKIGNVLWEVLHMLRFCKLIIELVFNFLRKLKNPITENPFFCKSWPLQEKTRLFKTIYQSTMSFFFESFLQTEILEYPTYISGYPGDIPEIYIEN